MRPFILTSFATLRDQRCGELEALNAEFGAGRVGELFADIVPDALVVPRFRTLPLPELVEREVLARGGKIINTFRQHRNIADALTWIPLLDGTDGLTPLTPTAYGLEHIASLPEGEWFVKGETNSLKNQWLQACYAPTTKSLMRVTATLLADSYVGTQRVLIRPFQSYRRLATAVNAQPVFHERRAFVLDGHLLSDAFYWSSWTDEIGTVAYDVEEYQRTLAEAIERIGHLARFIVIDMAEYNDGRWGVVELNDACMAGLSDNDPAVLWRQFSNVLKNG